MHALSGRTKSQKDWPDNPEMNPITIKPKAASHMAEQSWVPLPFCSPLRRPFAIKSLPLSACMSPQTIHFRVLDKSPLSGHPPPCNIWTSQGVVELSKNKHSITEHQPRVRVGGSLPQPHRCDSTHSKTCCPSQVLGEGHPGVAHAD